MHVLESLLLVTRFCWKSETRALWETEMRTGPWKVVQFAGVKSRLSTQGKGYIRDSQTFKWTGDLKWTLLMNSKHQGLGRLTGCPRRHTRLMGVMVDTGCQLDRIQTYTRDKSMNMLVWNYLHEADWGEKTHPFPDLRSWATSMGKRELSLYPSLCSCPLMLH